MRNVLCLLMLLASRSAWAEPDTALVERLAELERRVTQLESENRALRGTLSVLPHIEAARNGLPVEVRVGDVVAARFLIAREGWGDSRVEDVAAVVQSVAHTMFTVLPPWISRRLWSGDPHKARGP